MTDDLQARFPNLGKLSLALLEHIVDPFIGSEAREVLKAPVVEKELRASLGEVLAYAEERFTKEHADAELCRAVLDLPLADLASFKQAVREFYDRPTDPTLRQVLRDRLVSDFPQMGVQRIEAAVTAYLTFLRQEITSVSAEIREKLNSLALQDMQVKTAQMVELLQSIREHFVTAEGRSASEPVSAPSAPPSIPQPPASAANPFFTGGAVPPDLFVGRASALALVRSRLGGRSLQSVSIVGERRIGKSSLLRCVRERTADLFDPRPIVIYLDLMMGYCHTRAGFTRALRRELKTALGREPWPSSEDSDLATLSFALEDLSRAGVRLVLCLDEVEELTKRRAEFDDLLEALRAAGQMGQVGLLTASSRPLADLCQSDGLISPFFNIFLQETLGLLSDAEWRALVRDRMSPVTDADLQAIERLAGGHPFYTQLAASRLWAARNGGESDWVPLALADMQPHWASQWGHLSPAERTVLKDAAGFSGLVPDTSLVEPLRRRGFLQRDRYRLFSEAFGDWVATVN